MTDTFKRERRYIVLKITDVLSSNLSTDQLRTLNQLCDTIAQARAARGKVDLQTVVVESDWPEYEAVWTMIERRSPSTSHSTFDQWMDEALMIDRVGGVLRRRDVLTPSVALQCEQAWAAAIKSITAASTIHPTPLKVNNDGNV